jgi:hypothetical protein
MRRARQAGPKPLSMLTLAMPEAQAASTEANAVRPPYATP